MLEVKNLNQYYGESHILWDVAIHVPESSCTCLMGRNGVGKTTFLKAIMGLLPIKSGRVLLGNQDISQMTTDQRARQGIGYVPQGREIFPQLSVEENLKVGMVNGNQNQKEIPEFVFDYFPILKTFLKRRGGDLSGGQQQQLAIARALILNPKLLMLDEPTEGIQPNIVHEIGDIIIRLVEEKSLTVLLVEQKLPFARRVAQYFSIMDKGNTVAGGKIKELDDSLINQHLTV